MIQTSEEATKIFILQLQIKRLIFCFGGLDSRFSPRVIKLNNSVDPGIAPLKVITSANVRVLRKEKGSHAKVSNFKFTWQVPALQLNAKPWSKPP
jgi:hypothetical protein